MQAFLQIYHSKLKTEKTFTKFFLQLASNLYLLIKILLQTKFYLRFDKSSFAEDFVDELGEFVNTPSDTEKYLNWQSIKQ